MMYVVRFGGKPTNYSNKEAKLVEADSELDAVLAVADMLIRRGDDPSGFCPIGRICELHKELGKKNKYIGERFEGDALVEHIKKEDITRQRMISNEIAEWVEEFTPPPKNARII